jgi:hypothetical protein
MAILAAMESARPHGAVDLALFIDQLRRIPRDEDNCLPVADRAPGGNARGENGGEGGTKHDNLPDMKQGSIRNAKATELGLASDSSRQ